MKRIAGRLPSIDILRAITMFLMIFVNDLWTLQDIPQWLGHTQADIDGMGLADIIFPAFLLIVGLSIPFAMAAREKKGYTFGQNLLYILSRSLALIVMGFFHVNLENYGEAALLIKPVWQIGITVAFFLIWLDYSPELPRRRRFLLQGLGISLLIVAAVIYRDNAGGAMQTRWWGILGLIGWSYLVCTLVYYFSRGSIAVITIAVIAFLLFNAATHAGWMDVFGNAGAYIWLPGGGAMTALTMTGVLASAFYTRFGAAVRLREYYLLIGLFAGVLIALALYFRPLWGISKIKATPSWTMICAGITLLLLLLFMWLTDKKQKANWMGPLQPAGTSTLTCYLLPYIHYAVYSLIGYSLPLVLRTGIAGIAKSLVYSLLIILAAGLLEKYRLRLKV